MRNAAGPGARPRTRVGGILPSPRVSLESEWEESRDEVSTDGDLGRELEREPGGPRLHGDGVQTVGRGHGPGRAAINRDGALADPARDADVVGERPVRLDRRAERIAERIQGVDDD